VAKKVALTIYFDENTGEVDTIKSTKRFSDEGALFRIDVLKDAIETLESIYQYEKTIFFNEFNNIGEA
tara:strand:- start:61 stop:264 length:204 start_codon:yes stop_codon:yes gene_type:complete